MKYIICFLTVQPSKLFYNFCKKLKNKNNDIYICIDNNNHNIENYDNKIKIIKIDNKICEDKGFKNTVLWCKNRACSRDKALCYFCNTNINFDYIWFIEEDVFIPSIHTIEKINNKYTNCDLLTSSNILYDEKPWVHWEYVLNTIEIPPPYSHSMISAIRCSKKLLKYIYDYATNYKKLILDEVLFNTLAMQNNLVIVIPEELSTIVFKKNWKIDNINMNNLYHPIKNTKKHHVFRRKLQQNLKDV
jgi:hypothetical protein